MTKASKTNTETIGTAQEEKYHLKDLIENCEALTGYKKEVAVGALSNCTQIEMTKTEFKNTIKNFLNRKVE